MKRIQLIIFVLGLGATSVMAQKHTTKKEKSKKKGELYGRLGMNFTFPQAGQTLDVGGRPYSGGITNNTSTGSSTYNAKGVSFSSGVHAGAAIGYMFNSHIGIELGITTGVSTPTYSTTENNIQIDSVARDYTFTRKAKYPTMLLPSIVLQTGGRKLNAYARAGLALPLASKLAETESFVNEPGTGAVETIAYTIEMKHSFGVGFAGAMGVQYFTSARLGFWLEGSLLSLSLYTKEETLTDITVNGYGGSASGTYISQVPASQRTITYSKNATLGGTSNEQPAFSQPFSNFGIGLGIVYRF